MTTHVKITASKHGNGVAVQTIDGRTNEPHGSPILLAPGEESPEIVVWHESESWGGQAIKITERR